MANVEALKIDVSADTGNLTEKLNEATEALDAFAAAADRANAALAKLSAGHRVEVTIGEPDIDLRHL